MKQSLIIVGHDELYDEPIYAATPGGFCPQCGDLLYQLPDGPHMCGWCDILVAVETESAAMEGE